MQDFEPILNYWFAKLNDEQVIGNSPVAKRWFIKDEGFDRDIQRQFEEVLQKATKGEYRHWEDQIRGRLALIILLDQFSRNIYRDSKKMFENDSKALELTLRTIEENRDKELKLIERKFLYMPLMHSEDFEIQEMSLKCYEDIITEARTKNPQNVSLYEMVFDYAKRHYKIIKRFGRYPHRNAILNRVSTSEEEKFLIESNSGF